MYTVIFTGSRHLPWERRPHLILEMLFKQHKELAVKVGDCSTGLDFYVRDWMSIYNRKLTIFYADWKTHGRSAGPIRNHEMVDSGADEVIAFPDEDSIGTKDCAEYAYSKGIPVWFPELPYWAQWATPINSFRDY